MCGEGGQDEPAASPAGRRELRADRANGAGGAPGASPETGVNPSHCCQGGQESCQPHGALRHGCLPADSGSRPPPRGHGEARQGEGSCPLLLFAKVVQMHNTVTTARRATWRRLGPGPRRHAWGWERPPPGRAAALLPASPGQPRILPPHAGPGQASVPDVWPSSIYSIHIHCTQQVK